MSAFHRIDTSSASGSEEPPVATGSRAAERPGLGVLNRRLARVAADSAEMLASIEEKNEQLAVANARAAELMAELELRDERIQQLNSALSAANARASELVAELEEQQATIEAQTEQLLRAERERVMLESVGAACHHLSQPFTVLTIAVSQLRHWNLGERAATMLGDCDEACREVETVLQRLRRVAEYRTEPYIDFEDETGRHRSHILAL